MLYLKHVAIEAKKALELKYEINIEIEENLNANNFNLVIKNCPNNLLAIIEKEIKSECERKVAKNYTTDYLPGLKAALSKKGPLENALVNISSKKNNSFLYIIIVSNIMYISSEETNSVIIPKVTVKPINKSSLNVDSNKSDVENKNSMSAASK